MGELASATGVTKRTIDYYTNRGLLTVERSTSNYRYYDKAMIKRIYWIEEQKTQGKCLDEIQVMLTPTEEIHEEIDVQLIRLQMRKLEHDVNVLMEHLDEDEKQKLRKRVSPESVALMQSLLLILNH
nr:MULTISPECIES: MerR family transcriptional regulator [unclassified Lysinibacillus]